MSGKALFSLIAGLAPVVWFGWLATHFYQVNDAMGGQASRELMPTIVGLGGIGLLFSLPILIKLVRLVSGTKPKPKNKKTPRDASVAADDDSRGDFDPDAVIARYLEKKAAGEVTFEVPERPAPRPSFGRKTI